MKRLTMGCGFITNSSSVVHYFDKALLDDPEIAAFITAYGLQEGLMGEEMYSRSHCSSFLVTREMKLEAEKCFKADTDGYEMSTPSFAVDEDDTVVLVYGDEYQSFASILCHMLEEAAERLGKGDKGMTEFH